MRSNSSVLRRSALQQRNESIQEVSLILKGMITSTTFAAAQTMMLDFRLCGIASSGHIRMELIH